jgi:hypothetical protein
LSWAEVNEPAGMFELGDDALARVPPAVEGLVE